MTTFDFMGKRKIAAAVSIVLVVVSVGSVIFLGVNRGLDFTGGVRVELGFETAVTAEQIRALLTDAGYTEGVVQSLGSETEVRVRMPPLPGVDQSELGDDVVTAVRSGFDDVTLRNLEFVGPAVGEELTEKGGLALLVALGVVMFYIMWRFTGKFAVGAVAALVHDVVITVGAFSVFQWTFNLPELAALLAVIGYSLNDTIVVSDRIRENFRSVRRGTPFEIINQSLNQTLGRTLVTSLTTLLVLVVLLIVAGDQISGFATALTIGVVVGTYSSIYVAANVLLAMGITKQDLALPEREGADETP
ncbi:MAG: protein translocase subunit SecF [Gammaproteobacteria bacterium]|nr:protein translocase subunit SecF [Gammaproteobacteria bacterium]MDE0440740.1 protein translocase subunit SecF [Gammaproteobacteria bacterium]